MKTFSRFQEILIEEVKRTSFKKESESSGSFVELLFPTTSAQSINIKMGNVVENSFKKFVAETAKNLIEEEKNNINNQLDLLFFYNDFIYYFEVKNNLNIDTEKSKATSNKISEIQNYLNKKYGEKVIAKALSARYDTIKNIKNTKIKYINKTNTYGYSDFFNIFEISVSIKEWEEFFKKVGIMIIESSA
jgi:hypothetical protein